MTNTRLVETLAGIPGKLTAAIENLPKEELIQELDGWTPLQILGHLKDAAVIYGQRVIRVATEDNPLLPGYDQDAYVAAGDYNNASPSDLLATIATARAETIALLEGLRNDDWHRPGVHGETGPLTLLSLAEHMVEHETSHLADLGPHAT